LGLSLLSGAFAPRGAMSREHGLTSTRGDIVLEEKKRR
jgi:hypothetical protein